MCPWIDLMRDYKTPAVAPDLCLTLTTDTLTLTFTTLTFTTLTHDTLTTD